MLSVLDPQGVEKQLQRMPGVRVASVNIATNTAVIEYDEAVTNVEALRIKITECGLTQADVGFAIGAGTDVAIESADVVLMKSDPYDVVGAVELSHATLRKMHQNLWWAVGYNVIAFPLAAGVFYPFLLSPEIAALAMSGSSALVAINALMLKRTKLPGITRYRSVQSFSGQVAENPGLTI